jgi:hypothetical protein
MKLVFVASLFWLTDEPEHEGLSIFLGVYLPVLHRPCVNLVELWVIFHKLSYECLSLSSVSEVLIESQSKELGLSEFDSLRFFFLDHGNDIWLEYLKTAWGHLKLEFELLHGSWYEVLVASFVQQLEFSEIVDGDVLI